MDDQIREEKQQCHINIETAKTSAFLLTEFNKNEYLTGEEILPSNPKKYRKS